MTQTIIAVDDENIILKSLEYSFREFFGKKYNFEFCESGEEALAVLDELMANGNDVPIIITDYIMPNMKGDELLEIVHNKFPNILSIMLTGMATLEGLSNAINNANLFQFVTKPWDPTQFSMAIKKAIQQYDTKKELELKRVEIEKANVRLTFLLEQDSAKSLLLKELKESETKLKETVEIKDKFFSIIAHDLRGPFSGFLGLTELMVNRFNTFSVNELEIFIKSIQSEANVLYDLLENLLKWAQMQRGTFEFNPVICNLPFIIYHNLEISSENAKKKDIKFINQFTEHNDLNIFADFQMLNAIFRNLLSNAIKFTPNGGEIEIGYTTIQNQSKNGDACIFIKDSGIGMSEELIVKLFKPNEKVSRTGTNDEPSTGLGLLLCKEFVEKNNGKIWVESEQGKGSKFYFTIPLLKMDE